MWGYCTAFSQDYEEGLEERDTAVDLAEMAGEGYIVFRYDENEVIQEAYDEMGDEDNSVIGKTLSACF